MPLTKGHTRLRLPDLLSRVSSHEFLIPEFQRDLVWKPEQVRELWSPWCGGTLPGSSFCLSLTPPAPLPPQSRLRGSFFSPPPHPRLLRPRRPAADLRPVLRLPSPKPAPAPEGQGGTLLLEARPVLKGGF